MSTEDVRDKIEHILGHTGIHFMTLDNFRIAASSHAGGAFTTKIHVSKLFQTSEFIGVNHFQVFICELENERKWKTFVVKENGNNIEFVEGTNRT